MAEAGISLLVTIDVPNDERHLSPSAISALETVLEAYLDI